VFDANLLSPRPYFIHDNRVLPLQQFVASLLPARLSMLHQRHEELSRQYDSHRTVKQGLLDAQDHDIFANRD
jgi:hypothetical protein